MEAVLRAARIGAFAGLAVTCGALGAGRSGDWLLEPLWPREEQKKGKEEQGEVVCMLMAC